MNKILQQTSRLWLWLAVLLFTQPLRAQLLTDDFSAAALPYSLTAQGGWSAHSGAGTNSVQATAPGLTYDGVGTAGGAATLTTSGEDVNRQFTQQSSGSVYASFLVNVASAQATGDYFFHLGPANLGTTFIGRIFVKSVSGGIQFGVSKGTDAAGPVYNSTVYATGTTYLLVLKYTFVAGSTTNDQVDLFIQPAIGQPEPAPAISTTSTVADLANAGTVALRQGTASSAANLRVDYIRVGTTWTDVTSGSAPAASLSATPTTLTGFNANQGSVSNVQTYTLTGANLDASPVSVSATVGIELSPNGTTFSSSPLTINTTSGNVSQVVYVRLANTLPAGAVNGTITNTSGSGQTVSVTVNGQVNGANQPTLTASPTTLAGFSTTQGTVSAVQTFTLSGRSLNPGSYTATASVGFEISLDENTGYTNQFTFSNLPDPFSNRIYVRLAANAPAGPINGTISLSGSNNTSATVMVSGNVASNTPYTPIAAARASVGQTVTIQGRVTATNQLGSRQIYVQDETGGIAVYSGATGTDLTTVVQLGDLIQVRGPIAVFNGFLEVNGVTGYTVVAGAGTVIPEPVTVMADQLASYQGQLVRITDASISPVGATFTGGTNYILTANGQSTTLRISANSPLAGAGRPANSVTVTGIADRFVSGATTTGTNGLQLQPRILADIPGAAAAQDQTCTLPGSSGLPLDQTLDVATWNMEFFGADAGTINCPSGTLVYNDMGPVNEDLQQTNATLVLSKLNADIISVEEVSDVNRLQAAVSSLPGKYSYVCSDKFSYFFQDECDQVPSGGTVFGPTRFAQKVCVIYNTATVTPIPSESKPLLFGKTPDYTYPGAIGGNGNGSGWASGRLPYLFVANVTINGVTKKVHVVGVHGKSGSAKADFDRRTQDYNDLKAELDANYPNANVIILGDYNDKATSSIYTSSPVSSFNSFVADMTNYNVLTKPLEQQGCSTFNSSASFIDQIIVSNDLQPAYVANSTYVLQPFSIPNYGNTTSDHNPVVTRFDLSKLTTPDGNSLALLMPTYNCQTGAITFRTSGGDGTAIEFFGLGITHTWTTEPNQVIDAEKRSDPNSGTIITLKARQSGREVSLDFDFGAYCRSQGSNLPPSVNLTLPAQTGKVGQFFSYKLPDGTFSDPESQPLTLSATGMPAGVGLTPPDLRLVSGTPTQAGTFTALITASDPQGASVTTFLVINVLPAGSTSGQLVVAQAIPNQSGLVGQFFSFRIPDATFSGPVASVDVSDLPRGLAYFSDTHTIAGTVSQPDSRFLTVTALDGRGGKAQTGFTLSFTNGSNGGNGSLAVAQTIPNQNGLVGQFFSFHIPDATFLGPVASVDVSDLPRGLFYHSDTRTFDGMVSQPDSRNVTVTAMDAQGNRVQTSFLLSFTTSGTSGGTGTSNQLMVARSIPDQSGNVGQYFSFRIPDATFAGTVASVDVSDLPRGLAYFSDTHTIAGTVSQPDSRLLTVTALDGQGGKAQTRFTLTFTSANGRLAASPEPTATLRATLLPNPVGEEFTVRIEGAQDQTVRFTLTDISGNRLTDHSVAVTAADHKERIRLGQRPSGLYLLRVGTGRQTITLKVVKQ